MSGRELNEAVTRRITEIMSAAGVPHDRASLEVLYFLPKEFVDKYIELFDSALKFADGQKGEADAEREGVSGAYRGKRPMVGAGGKRYKEHWIVRSENALDLKRRVDKRLRSLGREILEELRAGDEGGEGEEREGRIRCARCGRMMAKGWNFCAGCGNHRPVGGE